MPAIHQIHARQSTNKVDPKRLTAAIVIGIAAFFALITFLFLRHQAQKRHGFDTQRVFASRASDQRPPHNRPDTVIADWDRRHNRSVNGAEVARREEVIRRAAERRRLETIYLEQLNQELVAEEQEPKPPGYAPPLRSMLDVDGTGTLEITRPVPAAGREGEELPSYEPRASLTRPGAAAEDRGSIGLDDAAVEAVVADAPPAYTPRPGDGVPAPATTVRNRAIT